MKCLQDNGKWTDIPASNNATITLKQGGSLRGPSR